MWCQHRLGQDIAVSTIVRHWSHISGQLGFNRNRCRPAGFLSDEGVPLGDASIILRGGIWGDFTFLDGNIVDELRAVHLGAGLGL